MTRFGYDGHEAVVRSGGLAHKLPSNASKLPSCLIPAGTGLSDQVDRAESRRYGAQRTASGVASGRRSRPGRSAHAGRCLQHRFPSPRQLRGRWTLADIGFYEHASSTVTSAYEELRELKTRNKMAYAGMVGRLNQVATAPDVRKEADADVFDSNEGIYYYSWYNYCIYYCLVEPSPGSGVRPFVLRCADRNMVPQSKLDAEAYHRRRNL